jgi:hypothetical protein
VRIEGFGSIDINVQVGKDTKSVRTITLQETALVSSFHTSVASLKCFIQKGVHWNTATEGLTYRGKPFCNTLVIHGQWVLEYIKNDNTKVLQNTALLTTQVHQDAVLSSYGPCKDLTGTAKEWHNRMGHLNQNAIRKLQEKTQGVVVTDMSSYDTNCEVCRLTHATKSISRRSTPRSKIPYEKVHLDLIQMPEAYDGSTQVLHF